MERVKGIEPSSSAWKAVALPLSYTRLLRQKTECRHPEFFVQLSDPVLCLPYTDGGGGSRTRTYEGLASGFTVRPLCRSGHSPVSMPAIAPRNIHFGRIRLGKRQ